MYGHISVPRVPAPVYDQFCFPGFIVLANPFFHSRSVVFINMSSRRMAQKYYFYRRSGRAYPGEIIDGIDNKPGELSASLMASRLIRMRVRTVMVGLIPVFEEFGV